MSETLPPLRPELDFMPSPVSDRPGLLIRDPFLFSDVTLIIPPPLVQALRCFDGQQSDLDLRQALVQATGEFDVSALQQHLIDSLSHAGFLIDDSFLEMRDSRIAEFAAAPERHPIHAGAAYPDDPAELRGLMNRYLSPNGAPDAGGRVRAIAAPHVSPEGGWESYRDAYLALPPAGDGQVFVVLGTSHYGEPEKYGLTRKPYVTPFGATRTETALIDHLAARAPGAVTIEDYAHAIEHSIEFQIVFLQALYGPNISVLPILCGPFAHSIYEGGKPEDDDGVKAFLDTLGELAEREKERLVWVLGVDMAHMGARYGDPHPVQTGDFSMQAVEMRDRARIAQVLNAAPDGYWSLIQENQDDLKWCGSAPIYTFLRTVPDARGSLRRYQQWNIDEGSVVSFAALSFE